MSFSHKEEFDVLHGVRIKGMAQPEEIATAVGLDPSLVERVLDDAVEKEHVRKRSGGRVQGYMLTAKGRERHEELRADNVPAQLDDLAAAYGEFLAPNRDFKAVTTKWQTEANGDPSVVLPELVAIDECVGKVLSLASNSVPRMQSYVPRFRAALDAFQRGETSALARPMSGSYHDVWMELHEDLLLVLGRERTHADE
ncbi:MULTISPECIES: MarR family transcriptional regulator [unclassified Rhodococcus (in: high G+C Gram-positive bacteria)]|uniref:MarR family transcriptional regulator n=1 Tax=unclassified Rhodococcus (in: high G+C Gram-positive bacteria) TaxID=192944 RepID=UPI0016399039|nr:MULTISPECIES: MarR family transcriptional regulator [unclassified Rhodococcus (in: high G+C Gram-positive bacteria)]MBC2637607.1 MarR family transcriptional regulator [Rhodococcus sp. 3A]MBC2897649.1 MarR family transcriptional regulator [Rhodococcus sp. 4CII]